MEKAQAANELTKRGYDSRVVDGIVRVNRDPNTPGIAKEIRDLMKDIGYEYSWGIHLEKGLHMQTEESVSQDADDMSEESE